MRDVCFSKYQITYIKQSFSVSVSVTPRDCPCSVEAHILSCKIKSNSPDLNLKRFLIVMPPLKIIFKKGRGGLKNKEKKGYSNGLLLLTSPAKDEKWSGGTSTDPVLHLLIEVQRGEQTHIPLHPRSPSAHHEHLERGSRPRERAAEQNQPPPARSEPELLHLQGKPVPQALPYLWLQSSQLW